ncbi:MAG: hypothetical protein AVO39_03800 [delta proteobacterium MLS_D]|nr:MAG: hypothetical protein AVO39_03800 [delta proteobacterium MLS_D]
MLSRRSDRKERIGKAGRNVREDTIVAIATPVGTGGIGVLRVSGDRSEDICRRLFKPRNTITHLETHRLYHGDIVDGETGRVLDEVLVTLMRGPRSYTGEDVLEISCHGNPLILQSVLDTVLRAGARSAEPGEFTKRAFLNNRIDLAQAEAVADLVTARSERGMQQALFALKGRLSKKIRDVQASFADVLAFLETSIDFTDEDITLPDEGHYLPVLRDAVRSGRNILATYDRGALYRKGLTAVIVGRPNVGKSSLLNRLAGEKRAIVTEIPGTTRDLIEVDVDVSGLSVRFIDTAGIRESDQEIEREGVRLARMRSAEADLVIAVIDGSEGFFEEDRRIMEDNRDKRVVVAINKSDLPQKVDPAKLTDLVSDEDVIVLSAKLNRGIDRLKERVVAECDGGDRNGNDVLLTNLRHREALREALESAERAARSMETGESPELPAFELQEALRHFALITGENAGDDVLDQIFSRFCIGK